MHLAVFSCNASVLLYYNGSIMINTGSPALEEREDQDNAELLRKSTVGLCRRTRNRFSKVAEGCLFMLTEVH